MTTTVAGDGILVRGALPHDNGTRCELFARVAMESDVVLSVHREPEFDALYRLQSEHWLSLVVERDGVVEGTGSVVIRDGYLNGEVRRVGYLGDLRLSPRLQGRLLLERFYREVLEDVREQFGCELFLTSVIASNARALRALSHETDRSRRAGRPRYRPVGDFDIRSIHLLLPRLRTRSRYGVRRATAADKGAIARFLDADQRKRPFGFVLDDRELDRRLRSWPGLGVDSFLLAEDERGALAGCIALWDAAPVKQMVVTAYRGAMRRVRTTYNVAAFALGAPRLPAPPGVLRYQYVTHQAIRDDDPAILRALLVHAYREVRRSGKGYHFLSVCAPCDGRLDPAFAGFQMTNLRARLFVVALPGVDVSAAVAPGVWPGFEMALV